MKNLFSILFLALPLAAQALESVPVNIRSEGNAITAVKMDFPMALAENDEFKILNSMDSNPIDFTSSQLSSDDRLRAATVLYHLKVARDYFVNELGSDYVRGFPQMNVRVNMSKRFNEFYHFVKDSKNDDYNNAVTIPASTIKAMPGVEPWQMEIWFRPAKPQNIDNAVYQSSKQMLDSNVGGIVIQNVVDQQVQQSVTDSAIYGSFDSLDYMSVISRLAYTVGLLEVVPRFFMWATKSVKTEAYLDTSMIPEVSYHEFTHAAMSDYISIRQSTPLNEGIANYFAAVILGKSKIADKNGKYSKSLGAFNGKSKQKYSYALETSNASHANFVFAFLWSLRERMNKEFSEGDKLSDKLIFASRKHVKYTGKPIKDDLVGALVDASDDVFSSNEARKARMVIKDHALKTGI